MGRTTASPSRITSIDIARGVALVAMAVYHFGWDLEFFHYMEPGTTVSGGWRLFARSIAASFLFLVGVSLFLAHARGTRWRPFLKRLAMVAAAAAAISAVTWFFMPSGFIFFGILHHITLASLLGLAFLRLPAVLVLLLAAATVAAPHFLSAPLFNHPALWWVGLSTFRPHSNDFVPLFPWFGAVLAGIGTARIVTETGVIERIRNLQPGAWGKPFSLAGRHSLAFYLLHQPVLIATVWLFAQVLPAAETPVETRFSQACVRQCEAERDAPFCAVYCACVLDTLDANGNLDAVMSSSDQPGLNSRLSRTVAECTMTAQTEPGPGERNGTRQRP